MYRGENDIGKSNDVLFSINAAALCSVAPERKTPSEAGTFV
jgi:hypothetical protein